MPKIPQKRSVLGVVGPGSRPRQFCHSRSPFRQFSNGDNRATPSTSSGTEQGLGGWAGLHVWLTAHGHAHGDRICGASSSRPGSPCLPASRLSQAPRPPASAHVPPSATPPAPLPAGHAGNMRRPQSGWSSPPPLQPRNGLPFLQQPRLRPHHDRRSAWGARAPASWSRGPGSRAAGGSKVNGGSEERVCNTAPGMRKTSLEGRGVSGDVCGMGGVRAGPASGSRSADNPGRMMDSPRTLCGPRA